MATSILELEKSIIKASTAYYYSDTPIMSDYEFDDLVEDLRSLDSSNPIIEFSKWLFIQKEYKNTWYSKHYMKCHNAKIEGLICYLTFEEYLYKAYQAGITHPDQISNKGYHLSRINDKGDYTVKSCRFITAKENYAEKDYSWMVGKVINPLLNVNKDNTGENNGRAYFTNEQVIKIFHDLRPSSIVATEYNVEPYLIDRIRNKHSYTSATVNLMKPLDLNKQKLDEEWKNLVIKVWYAKGTQENIGKEFGIPQWKVSNIKRNLYVSITGELQ